MADQTPEKKPLVPTLTGNPVIDMFLGTVLMSGSTVLATTCLTWMNSHGFTGITFEQLLGTFVGIGGMVFTVLWRYIQTKKTKTAIADHTMTAISTGVIPDSVVKEAVAAPAISEMKIETALNNAAVIKENK